MNQKMIKKRKKNNSDKDSLANEDGKTFKEDEKEFSYNNIKNILLADSNNFYDNDILSENKIEFDNLKSYSYKRFLIIDNSLSDELKKIIFDEIVALKLKLRKYKINEFIEKVRFGFNNLDIESH